jgi:hypothetical protein
MDGETRDKLASLLTHEDESYLEQGMAIARALGITPSEIVMILPRKRIVLVFDGINDRRWGGIEEDVWEETGRILFAGKSMPQSLMGSEAKNYLKRFIPEAYAFSSVNRVAKLHRLSDEAKKAAAQVADTIPGEFFGYNDPNPLAEASDDFPS